MTIAPQGSTNRVDSINTVNIINAVNFVNYVNIVNSVNIANILVFDPAQVSSNLLKIFVKSFLNRFLNSQHFIQPKFVKSLLYLCQI